MIYCAYAKVEFFTVMPCGVATVALSRGPIALQKFANELLDIEGSQFVSCHPPSGDWIRRADNTHDQHRCYHSRPVRQMQHAFPAGLHCNITHRQYRGKVRVVAEGRSKDLACIFEESWTLVQRVPSPRAWFLDNIFFLTFLVYSPSF